MSDYACTVCGKILPKDQLTAKKVLFSGIGSSATTFRTRTVDWLCESCLGKDGQYNYPANTSRTERMALAKTRREARSLPEAG